MISYCMGFYFFDESVLLIEKQQPDFLKGNWNGIGGHVEAHETPIKAQARAFGEETGCVLLSWTPIADILLKDAYLHVFAYYGRGIKYKSMTNEKVAAYPVADLPDQLCPSVKMLLSLCLDAHIITPVVLRSRFVPEAR